MHQWLRNEIEILVDLYKKYPPLYALKSTDCRNRNLKRVALEELTQQLNISLNKNINVEEVKCKISKLRTQFIEINSKIKASQTNGAGTNDLYQPTWYLYKRLEFIQPHIIQRNRKSNVCSPYSSCSKEQSQELHSSIAESRTQELYSSTIESQTQEMYSSIADSQTINMEFDAHKIKFEDHKIDFEEHKIEFDDHTIKDVITSPECTESPFEDRSRTQSPELVRAEDVTLSSSKSNEPQSSFKYKMSDSNDFFKEARQAVQLLTSLVTPLSKNDEELDYFFNYMKAESRKLNAEAQEYVKRICFNSIFDAKIKFP